METSSDLILCELFKKTFKSLLQWLHIVIKIELVHYRNSTTCQQK